MPWLCALLIIFLVKPALCLEAKGRVSAAIVHYVEFEDVVAETDTMPPPSKLKVKYRHRDIVQENLSTIHTGAPDNDISQKTDMLDYDVYVINYE